jgi:hypothetical protein
LDTLQEFNRAHDVTNQRPPDVQIAGKFGKRITRGGNTGIQLSQNLERIENLLDIWRLKRELDDLTEARAMVKQKL